MPGDPELTTARLLMRRWRASDRRPFAALNADAKVMEHFPSRLSAAESAELIARIEAHFEAHGYGLWALEVSATGEFVGLAGLMLVPFAAPFTPATEIGWRLRRSAWGRGYATEAARAALAFGFQRSGLDQIVSFTSVANERSRAVMARIGMTCDPADDFDHPLLPDAHRLRRHVLYRVSAGDWLRSSSEGLGHG